MFTMVKDYSKNGLHNCRNSQYMKSSKLNNDYGDNVNKDDDNDNADLIVT